MKKYLAVPVALAAAGFMAPAASAAITAHAQVAVRAQARNAVAARPAGQRTVARFACQGQGPLTGYVVFGTSWRVSSTLLTAGHAAFACGYRFNAPFDYSLFNYPGSLGLNTQRLERTYVGEHVRMVGMPGTGMSVYVSYGTVAALHQTVNVQWPFGYVDSEYDQVVIRGTSYPGMSGGPVLAPDGAVVGLVDWGTSNGVYSGGSPAYDL